MELRVDGYMMMMMMRMVVVLFSSFFSREIEACYSAWCLTSTT
jgi:hypothetical protein